MRAIRQVLSAKQKNSRFFDYFLKKYGDVCTTSSSEEEILKNLRQFYSDLVYGNIQQPKYMQFLQADRRIIDLALNDSSNKLNQAWIVQESLKFARGGGLQATLSPLFELTLNETITKYSVYTMIYNGLLNFVRSNGDMNYLVNISVTMNNMMNKGTKIQF